jgi:hypothetical protein
METKTHQRLTSKEFAVICRMISELKEEVLNVKNGVHAKIDLVTKSIKDAFEGFGILDPDEDTWTEQQVCEHYHVTRRTMYNYRKAGLITGYKPEAVGIAKSTIAKPMSWSCSHPKMPKHTQHTYTIIIAPETVHVSNPKTLLYLWHKTRN